MTVKSPSDIIQKYRMPQEATSNKCKDVITYPSDYPFHVPKIIYTGKTYFHLQVDSPSSPASTQYMEETLYEDLAAMTLDPLKWKEQDHYALLGLSMKRHAATENDIKKSYRKMILKYHPDKKQQMDERSPSPVKENADEEDNIFKCIQKAWEVLSDPERRRQYDSVDSTFDEAIPKPMPPTKLANNPGLFYSIYKPVFFRNARFSREKPVPDLGDETSSRAHVEAFYDFWYNFDSTRSFEYLDEEEVDSADNRYDKRYIERKNKAARVKRKTEDNARLRKLVEQAMAIDPRLRSFKEQDKADKERIKNERKAAVAEAKQLNRPQAAPSRPPPKTTSTAAAKPASPEEKPVTPGSVDWTIEELKCLIQAANKIPGGSLNRWEKIAVHVHDHCSQPLRSTQEIVQKCHELKHVKDAESLQRELRKKVDPRVNQPTAGSVRSDENMPNSPSDASVPWTKDEQLQLEAALRQFPPSTSGRWDEVSKCIPSRSKDQVVARFKELAQAARTKAAAAVQAAQ